MKKLEASVVIQCIKLQKIPAIFRGVHLEGAFFCAFNRLKTLENCPETVTGSFSCSFNPLESLEGVPKKVGGHFYCDMDPKKFSEADIRSVCDVKGLVFV